VKFQKLVEQVRKNGDVYYLMNILMVVVLLGGVMNFQAVASNGGKMPAKLDFAYEGEKHFSFQNDSEVKYPVFADRYSIGDLMFSLGDIFLVGGLVGYFSCLFVIFKRRKK